MDFRFKDIEQTFGISSKERGATGAHANSSFIRSKNRKPDILANSSGAPLFGPIHGSIKGVKYIIPIEGVSQKNGGMNKLGRKIYEQIKKEVLSCTR